MCFGRRTADPRSRVSIPARRRSRPDRDRRSRCISVDRFRHGAASICATTSSTNCTSAPSRPKARSTAPSASSSTSTQLGITVIEIMPVAAFPGARNWGYDGVSPYAVQANYGGPEGLKRLVDAAHRAGLAVMLDVVYNHLGPEGNYLPKFGPYFTASSQNAVGRRHQLRQRRLRARAPVCCGERAVLDSRVSPRRPAAGRGADHQGRFARNPSSPKFRSACRSWRAN